MSHNSFTVGWICALTTEYVAARALLDEEYEQPESVLPNDNNAYTLGRIGEHNVVIAVLPNGEYGISSAASVARDMMHSFPDIRIGMMVGIGGGAPSQKHDIRLGDVVVSVPGDRKGGVFQYDFGKTVQDQKFRPTGFLNQPPASLLTAVAAIRGQYEIHGHSFEENVNLIFRKHPRLQRKYSRPDPSTDRLYHSGFVHPAHDASCEIACGTDPSLLIPRAERTQHEDNPAIHYGVIASANQLMKDALLRDRLSAEEDILCFEMEAAGLMNHFPCIVIRGICDYSDSHKSKEWQGYAAMTAAAYAKDLLRQIAPKKIIIEKKFGDILSGLHEVAEEHREIAREQLQMQKDQFERMLSKEEQECHQLFRLTTGSTDATYEWYKDRVEERVEDTCLWFLRHEHFQRWLKQESGPLLVTADPGCGKSVLAKYLIDHALPRSNAICYFFFKDQDQNTVRQALCALLHQLFSQNPSLVKHAMPQYHKDGKVLISSTGSLWEILRNAVNDPQAGPVIIVLDALDECAESEFSYLIRSLERQFHIDELGHGKLKYLLTSRPYEQIVSKFSGLLDNFPKIRIPGEEESETISQEVNRVIAYRINQLSKRKRLSTDLKNYLEQRLRQTTHRTYLWVYLVFDYLEQENFKKTLKGIESTVVTLPKSVNEAYEQILSKSKEDPMVRKVLSIILAASRPLTLLEMNIAVNIDYKSQSIHDLDLEDEEDFKSRLRSWCGLFVSIHHNKIYFLHQTAREFLLADLPLPTATPLHLRWHRSITACQAHTVLAEVCVLYLNLFNSDPSLPADPIEEMDSIFEKEDSTFFGYSAKNWGTHFRKAGITGETAIMPFVLEICDPDSKSNSAWFTTYWASRRARALKVVGMNALWSFWRRDTESPKNLTDLMVASYLGHPEIVKYLVERGANIHLKDQNGWTALSWAAEEAHLNVVELLLKAGATVDCKYNTRYEEQAGYIVQRDISGGNPDYGHEGVRYLRYRVYGGRVYAGRVYGSVVEEYSHAPLLRAVEEGEPVTELRIETDKAEVDWRNKRKWTPLQWAIDGYVHTPLSRAAENGHEAVAQLLIETGKADVDSMDERNWTPLSWAIDGGHWTVVKLLLGAGATVHYKYNVSDEAGRKYEATTPLSRAAEIGHEAIVKLLLETSEAHIDWADKKGWRSLSWAVEGGFKGVVKLLLRAGATVHFEYSVDGQNFEGNARQSRTNYDRELYHRTPLSRAAQKGDEAVVKLLVEIGKADLDYKDKKAWTPLSWAIEGSHWATAKMLVKAGANIHHEYEVFEDYAWHVYTPLSRAEEKGQGSLVELILEASHSPHVMISRTPNISQRAESTLPEDAQEYLAQTESDGDLENFSSPL